MKKVFLAALLFLLSACTGDFSQRIENAARLAWVDYGRVESAPSSRGCALSPINWRGEHVALLLSLRRDMWNMFSVEIQRHIMNQFGMRLAQRGADVVDATFAQYEMRINPVIFGYSVSFRIIVLNRMKKPVAHSFVQYRLETPWLDLTERVRGELIETMVLNAFIGLCAGPPAWQW